MDWGFGRNLNEKVDVKKAKETEIWIMIKYTFKEISKVWKDDTFLKYAKTHKLDDILWEKWGIAERTYKLCLDGKLKKTDLKKKLEDFYQVCLKISNLSINLQEDDKNQK